MTGGVTRSLGLQMLAAGEPGSAEPADRMAPRLAVDHQLRYHAPHNRGKLEDVPAESNRPVKTLHPKRLELPVRIAMPRLTEPPTTSRRLYHLPST